MARAAIPCSTAKVEDVDVAVDIHAVKVIGLGLQEEPMMPARLQPVSNDSEVFRVKPKADRPLGQALARLGDSA